MGHRTPPRTPDHTQASDGTAKAMALALIFAMCWAPAAIAETPAGLPRSGAPPGAGTLAGCALSGLAVDEHGAPVPGAKIRAFGDPGGSRVNPLHPGYREVIATTTSDSHGRFLLTGLPPGKTELEVGADRFFERTLPARDLTSCATRLELGEIVLVAGAEVSGRVVDRRGDPVAEVYVRGRADHPESPIRHAKSSTDGRFSLGGLPHGQPVALSAGRNGYYLGEAITVEPPFSAEVTLVLDRLADLPQVAGRTLDPRGRPVASARVQIQKSRVGVGLFGGPTHASSFANSDAEGRFALEGVTVPSFTVGASAKGYQPVEVEIEGHRLGDEVALTLQPAATVEGAVLDSRDQPVAKVEIALPSKAPDALYHGTRSGDDGRYRLVGLPPGLHSIALRREGKGPYNAVHDVVLETGNNRLDFTLEPDSVVIGGVRGERGQPVAGAVVVLHPAGTGGGKPAWAATTGSDGRFEIRAVPRGRYAVEISKEGSPFVRLEDRVVVPTAGARVPQVELVLPDGGSIAGAVRGLLETEFSRLSVIAIDQAHSPYQLLAHLEADGSFRIPGLRPGAWWVKAEVGQRSRVDTAVVSVGAEARLDLDFGGGLQLTGQILRSGEPASNLPIDLENLETAVSYTTSTDEDGRFRLAGLEPGAHCLGYRVSNRRHTLERRFELDGVADLRFDLDARTTWVSGRVVDASSGQPLSGVALRLQSFEIAHEWVEGSSDEQGDFAVSGTLAGSYRLRAGRDGYSPLATEVVVRIGEPLSGLEIELAPVDSLSLEVRRPGEPPESVHFSTFDEAGRQIGDRWLSLGEDGRFEVRRVPRQGGWLLVRVKGSATIRLPISTPAPDLAPLWLEPEAVLEISTPAFSGPRRRVTLQDDRGDDVFLGYTGHLSIGGHGTLRIDGLPAGSWTLVVESVGETLWSEPVTTWTGQTTQLHLE